MIFNACATTAWRTAAASTVGARELSDKNAKTLGIIGCGQQAYYHIPAMWAIRNIENIFVHDVNEESMDKLVDEIAKSIPSGESSAPSATTPKPEEKPEEAKEEPAKPEEEEIDFKF